MVCGWRLQCISPIANHAVVGGHVTFVRRRRDVQWELLHRANYFLSYFILSNANRWHATKFDTQIRDRTTCTTQWLEADCGTHTHTLTHNPLYNWLGDGRVRIYLSKALFFLSWNLVSTTTSTTNVLSEWRKSRSPSYVRAACDRSEYKKQIVCILTNCQSVPNSSQMATPTIFECTLCVLCRRTCDMLHGRLRLNALSKKEKSILLKTQNAVSTKEEIVMHYRTRRVPVFRQNGLGTANQYVSLIVLIFL